ncbi:Unknown protein, partial [Striga hermonthica]
MVSSPNAKVLNIVKSSSDHSLLILNSGDPSAKPPKKFSFDKRWIGMAGFSETVQRAWKSSVQGTPFFKLKENVKLTRVALLQWSSSFHTKNQLLIQSLTQKLEDLRANKTSSNWNDWERTRKDLNSAHHFEELFWQQKSKFKWLKEGDGNTIFFHAFVQHRRKLNAITRLVSARGEEFFTQNDMEDHISDFYSHLFTSEGTLGGEAIIHLIPKTITEDMNQVLTQPVDAAEIKSTL